MNDTANGATKWIGQSVERLEDPPLVTGRGRFAGDINFARQLHMRIVRSNHAHANIVSIDTEAARALPGVVAVWTAADITDVPPIDFREGPIEKLAPYRQPVLAVHTVRYVGEPIAAVFAEDSYVAEDAADLVTMEVEELPPLLDARDDPGEFSFGRDTEADVLTQGYGDVEAVFKSAAHIVELKLTSGRHSGVPLECRGALGRYDASRDVLELHGAAKVPHRNKELIARMLNRAPASVQCLESHVGGGFGIRGELYPEDILVCVGAMRFERPVKWIEDRREHLIAANHSRNQHHHIRAACTDEGEILAIDDVIHHDNGAYVRTHATRVAMMTCGVLPGPYRVPGAYRAKCHFRLTNKTPVGTYRGPGRFEANFFLERMIDMIAADLGIDRIEFRRKNLITSAEQPYPIAHVQPTDARDEYDSGEYSETLDRALQEIDWPSISKLQGKLIDGKYHGLGVVCFVEGGAAGPKESARIEVNKDGTMSVYMGTSSVGQGVETVFAQIAADALEVPIERIHHVYHGSTAYVSDGYGAYHSRSTVMGGSAVLDATNNFMAALRQAAGKRLGCAESNVTLDIDKVTGGGRSMALSEFAGLTAEGAFLNKKHTYSYGAHVAHITVDARLGRIEIVDYVVVQDVGRAVNPLTLRGQVLGSLVQGLGGAVLEDLKYDENGQFLTGSLADYLLPTATDFPNLRCVVLDDYPSPINPLGAKGAGEGGIIAAGGCMANAVANALSSLGVQPRELPLSPTYIWGLVQAGQKQAAE
jgi:CO/xanthine dehydrogenase Mo-binding subunit